jgi:hypothetical protein
MVVELEQGMDFALDAEQGMEGVDEMKSSKSLPAAQRKEGGPSSLRSSSGEA